jgi:hypothetical protein
MPNGPPWQDAKWPVSPVSEGWGVMPDFYLSVSVRNQFVAEFETAKVFASAPHGFREANVFDRISAGDVRRFHCPPEKRRARPSCIPGRSCRSRAPGGAECTARRGRRIFAERLLHRNRSFNAHGITKGPQSGTPIPRFIFLKILLDMQIRFGMGREREPEKYPYAQVDNHR